MINWKLFGKYWFIPIAIVVFVLVIINVPLFSRLPQTPGWEKTIRGWGCDMEECIQQTSDGGYIAAGYINYGGTETSRIVSDIFIIKTDENGNV